MAQVVGRQAGRPTAHRRVRFGDEQVSVSARLWGDGCADDGLASVLRIDDWDDCSTDEYIAFFPSLAKPNGRLPEALLLHLTHCVAVRAWRADVRGSAVVVTSVPAHDVARLGPRLDADWFAIPVGADRATQARGTDTPSFDDDQALQFLDKLLSRERENCRGLFNETDGVRLAFLSGIHPAYLWPVAAVCPELYMAAGWLGHLQRGRRALMPACLAEYFLDVLQTAESGMAECRDERLSKVLSDPAVIRIVRNAAMKRGTGREAVTYWPDRRSRWAGSALWPSAIRSFF